jgi:hypothetical protein
MVRAGLRPLARARPCIEPRTPSSRNPPHRRAPSPCAPTPRRTPHPDNAARYLVAVSPIWGTRQWMWASGHNGDIRRGAHGLRADTRGRDGGVHEELAARLTRRQGSFLCGRGTTQLRCAYLSLQTEAPAINPLRPGLLLAAPHARWTALTHRG